MSTTDNEINENDLEINSSETGNAGADLSCEAAEAVDDEMSSSAPATVTGTVTGGSPAPSVAVSELLDYVEIFVFSVCAVILLFTFIFRLCRVDGRSMLHTLNENDILIVSDIYYEPHYGDIIVFHQTSKLIDDYNKPMVKRVIAVAGQRVKIEYETGKLYVSDDDVFDENDIIDESSYAFIEGGSWDMRGVFEVSVPDGFIFVMGDNRNNSADSRDTRIGLIDTRRIIGKVLLRILPVSAAGTVE